MNSSMNTAIQALCLGVLIVLTTGALLGIPQLPGIGNDIRDWLASDSDQPEIETTDSYGLPEQVSATQLPGGYDHGETSSVHVPVPVSVPVTMTRDSAEPRQQQRRPSTAPIPTARGHRQLRSSRNPEFSQTLSSSSDNRQPRQSARRPYRHPDEEEFARLFGSSSHAAADRNIPAGDSSTEKRISLLERNLTSLENAPPEVSRQQHVERRFDELESNLLNLPGNNGIPSEPHAPVIRRKPRPIASAKPVAIHNPSSDAIAEHEERLERIEKTLNRYHQWRSRVPLTDRENRPEDRAALNARLAIYDQSSRIDTRQFTLHHISQQAAIESILARYGSHVKIQQPDGGIGLIVTGATDELSEIGMLLGEIDRSPQAVHINIAEVYIELHEYANHGSLRRLRSLIQHSGYKARTSVADIGVLVPMGATALAVTDLAAVSHLMKQLKRTNKLRFAGSGSTVVHSTPQRSPGEVIQTSTGNSLGWFSVGSVNEEQVTLQFLNPHGHRSDEADGTMHAGYVEDDNMAQIVVPRGKAVVLFQNFTHYPQREKKRGIFNEWSEPEMPWTGRLLIVRADKFTMPNTGPVASRAPENGKLRQLSAEQPSSSEVEQSSDQSPTESAIESAVLIQSTQQVGQESQADAPEQLKPSGRVRSAARRSVYREVLNSLTDQTQ